MPKKNKVVDPEILAIINRLCNRDDLSFKQLERRIGLPASWLQKLATGEINDPSYTKIKKLKAYFTI
jgi:transcriptional regulator with XRE-family HTH domain